MKIYVFAAALLLSVTGCGNNKKSIVIDKKDWSADTVCRLQENIDFLGEINFISLNNDRLIASTKVQNYVFVYDTTGRQLFYINKEGRAEYEYISPNIVRIDQEGNIYVWCNMTLKMIIFDKNGTPLDEIRFSKAIRNFLPYRNLLCFYLSGGDNAIEIYDRDKDEVVLSAGTNPSPEHKLLSMNEVSGGMAILGDDLLFSYADKPAIHTVDLEKLVENDFCASVADAGFHVDRLDGDASDIINNDRNAAMAYLAENPVVSGIYVTETRVLLKAVTGKYDIGKNMDIRDDNRTDMIYVLDHDLNFLYAMSKVHSYDIKDKWYASDGKGLYYIELIHDDSDAIGYTLNKLRVD